MTLLSFALSSIPPAVCHAVEATQVLLQFMKNKSLWLGCLSLWDVTHGQPENQGQRLGTSRIDMYPQTE